MPAKGILPFCGLANTGWNEKRADRTGDRAFRGVRYRFLSQRGLMSYGREEQEPLDTAVHILRSADHAADDRTAGPAWFDPMRFRRSGAVSQRYSGCAVFWRLF